MLQGYTSSEISKRLGISWTQAKSDMKLAKTAWRKDYEAADLSEHRAEALSRLDFIYCEAVREYLAGKRVGKPVAKYLDVATGAVRDKVRLSGADIDLKFVQNNVNVSMASNQDVVDTFAPMSAQDFAAFADAHVTAQMKALEASQEIMPAPRPVVNSEPNVVDRAEAFMGAGDDSQDDQPSRPRFRHPRM